MLKGLLGPVSDKAYLLAYRQPSIYVLSMHRRLWGVRDRERDSNLWYFPPYMDSRLIKLAFN
jgi:hypothetical protein